MPNETMDGLYNLPSTLQKHNTESSKQIFPEKELRGIISNFHIHLSVSDLWIPAIGLHCKCWFYKIQICGTGYVLAYVNFWI